MYWMQKFWVTCNEIPQIWTEFIDFWIDWCLCLWDRKMCQSRDFVIPPPSCYCCTSCSKKTKHPNDFYSTFWSGKQRLWLDGAVTYFTELVTFVADQVSDDYNSNLCNLTQITSATVTCPRRAVVTHSTVSGVNYSSSANISNALLQMRWQYQYRCLAYAICKGIHFH